MQTIFERTAPWAAQSPLSKTDQTRVGLCVTCACLLLVSLLLAGGGYMAQRQERGRLAAYASDSATATGGVVGRSTEVMNGSVYYYDLDTSYTSPDGAVHKQTFRVPSSIFDTYEVGSSIPVTYVRSEPELFYAPGAEPDPANLQFLQSLETYSALAAVPAFFCFLVSLFAACNVGKQVGAPATPLRRFSQALDNRRSPWRR
jgi:hypothetical protein